MMAFCSCLRALITHVRCLRVLKAAVDLPDGIARSAGDCAYVRPVGGDAKWRDRGGHERRHIAVGKPRTPLFAAIAERLFVRARTRTAFLTALRPGRWVLPGGPCGVRLVFGWCSELSLTGPGRKRTPAGPHPLPLFAAIGAVIGPIGPFRTAHAHFAVDCAPISISPGPCLCEPAANGPIRFPVHPS